MEIAMPAQQPLTKRAYSFLTIKSTNTDDGKRIIRGVATTPTPDRMGDIVDPLGVTFKNPLPFLWQHDSWSPIGTCTFDKPTKDGITFVAELPIVEELGALKDRIDEAWQSIKLGLVRAVSIGFRAMEYSFMDEGGIRFIASEIYELSAVTIPAQPEAVITSLKNMDAKGLALIKRFDVGAPAATGRKDINGDVSPGASGKSTTKSKPTPKERTVAKTIAEQITALEAKRAANAARMGEIMQKSVDEGRSSDEAEQEEFDTVSDEVDKIDKDLERLRKIEKANAGSARAVVTLKNVAEGSAARGGASVKMQPKLDPGINFARFAKVKALSHILHRSSLEIAEKMYGADSDVVGIFKANEVFPGTTNPNNWAGDLVGPQGSQFADFAAYLRPATILGKFGQNGVPSLRQVPFRQPLISQTGGGASYWVGEGKPTPLTAFDFDRTTIEPLKIGNIAVLTKENIQSSSPSSDAIVRDALRDAIAAGLDLTFIDPTNAGTAGVKPASVTNGAAVVASTGTDADHIRLDIRALFQKFIAANNAPSNGVFILSSTNALALSIMVNALGQKEFPNMTMTGGILEGLPAIVSDYAGNTVALVNASDIYEADEGETNVDMSMEASLEMKNAAGVTQDGAGGVGAQLVSLWQNGLVGLKGERTINWKKRRASAVAYLSGVAWGGAVPNS
jgi:hypothetical protein